MEGILQGIALTGISTNHGMLCLRIIIEAALQLIPRVVRHTVSVFIPADQHNAGFGAAIRGTSTHIKRIAKNLYIQAFSILHRMIETKRNISTPSS